ncbi:YigZ family protein [Arenibacter sp. GZD96]|uniref:IMPACT family protein n=1 Tax=Aurantibrevibacter litoralis TaxID=3106030 RepID=UPI002AFEB787|nr:YigZ family protein [Arenibacter sp. GZD-96]MEA1786326.1 YigZ family protein [Arenibacter sp. GZD-96]
MKKNEDIDLYRTLDKATIGVLYKDRKSKFYGYAFPLQHDYQVKEHLETIRKNHPTANHVCFAWQLGVHDIQHRVSDDGEPYNSAGMPIYGQIQSHDLTNILVAVARIFGGTKLGVGGLIQAYKTTAQQTLNTSHIIVMTLQKQIRIHFGYPEMDKVMRIIKQQNATVNAQHFSMNCILDVAVRETEVTPFVENLESVPGIQVVLLAAAD